MKRHFQAMAMLAAVMLLAGGLQACGKSQTMTHAGTWELDIQVVKDAMEAEIAQIEDPEERQAMELGMAMIGAGMLDAMSMTLVLNPDGTASSTTSLLDESQTVHGTWSQDGDSLIILMTEGEQSDSVSAVVDGDTLELLPPEGEEMPFRMIMRKRLE
jgi:hypothetical protein